VLHLLISLPLPTLDLLCVRILQRGKTNIHPYLYEDTYRREGLLENWLMPIWWLRSPTTGHLQATNPGMLVAWHRPKLTAVEPTKPTVQCSAQGQKPKNTGRGCWYSSGVPKMERLAEDISPGHLQKVGHLPHSGGPSDPLQCLLGYLNPLLIVNGQEKQPWLDKGGSAPTGIRIWVSLSG
jgi:hypothetical protein